MAARPMLRLALALASLAVGRADDGEEQVLKVRLFWVRHGQSCANIMDRCAVKPPESNELLEKVERSLPSYPLGQIRNASLSRSFGVIGATQAEKDCSVELEGAGLRAGARGERGAIVRVHDLYLDPALTDCSRLQSVQAGRSFMRWLRASGVHLHFVGSSFLMRAFETACAMFLEPCSGTAAANCSSVLVGDMKVTPVPFMTERAPRGLTAAQADNMPREVGEQSRMIEAAYGRKLPIDSTFAETWPRYAQQYEKFKAFLAAELLPSIGTGIHLGPPGGGALRAALETALPESMRHEDHGKEPVSVDWEGGSYATGKSFSKAEYKALAAPEVNLAIVGHNQMMMEYCQQGQPPKPNNNAILEKLFILRSSAPSGGSTARKTVLRELEGKCAKVMDAPDGKLSMGALVQADVATCSTPFKVAEFLRLPQGGPLETTPCVKLGSEGAYPIMPDFLPRRAEL